MPDSAARRDPDEPREPASAEDEQALAELREILFHAERDELLALRERVHDPAQRARDVGEVLSDAVELRAAEGPDESLTDALRPTVERTLKESVQRDPQVIAEALFPAMGPAIRRAISEYFRQLVQSFDQAMQHSFSIQGIRWRIEAVRTGKSFSEVALLHSLVYRVEQVFLIHRETSLILQHLIAPEAATQDSDMVSGMYTAVKDFMSDSFGAGENEKLEGEALEAKLGDNWLWAEIGPRAALAVISRGQPPQSLHRKLSEVLEYVHAAFGPKLEKFTGDSSPFEAARDHLAGCFVTQRRERAIPPPRPYFVYSLVTVLALFAAWQVFLGVEDWRWGRFVDGLREQPGYTITSFDRGWFKRYYEIRGMRDPQAQDPFALLEKQGLNPALADFQLSPYYSLDDALVQKRATALLAPPPGVTLTVESGVLRARGEAPAEWARALESRAMLIAGVKRVDTSGLLLPGQSDFVRQRGQLSGDRILFSAGSAEIRPDQRTALEAVAEHLKALDKLAQEMGEELSVEVVGHTDSTGPDATNQRLSQYRAARVLQALVRGGLRAEILRAQGTGASEPLAGEGSEAERQINRCVTFRVLRPAPGAQP
ncbi:MAG TPA: OmpA family protein [Candidatus Acidoferrales bacterium]|nr:OmpA family protein [Candidatus Acidoferrales bacterium]